MSLGIAGAGLAQTPIPRVTLSGVVLDPMEAGVADAKISLQRRDGSNPSTMSADATGGFRFDGVQAGRYSLSVDHEG
jgi:hypothetical protein